MSEVEIRPLSPSDFPEATALLALLNTEISESTLQTRFERILEEHAHYQALGAFVNDTLVGVAGAWIATKIWCGRYLEIDNLVVSPGHRSSGVGTRLMNHLEALAAHANCEIMVLDSYTSNHASHRLYHRLGFEIFGFHFVKSVIQRS